ncbi:MAG: ABC transporter substrate-binding protein [Nitrospinota bacterium]
MMRRSWVLLILMAAALALALSPAAYAATKLHIGMPTPKPNVVHIPPSVAKEMGFFKEQGLDVKISTFRGGTRAHQALTASGTDLDMADIPGPLLMSGIERGSGQKIFYSFAAKNEAILAVGAGIKTAADLKGKKLGVEGKFGYSHLGMLSVLQPAGITDDDVTYVRTFPPQRVSFLISGKVDAVLIHIEQVAVAKAKTKGKVHELARIWKTQPHYFYAAFAAPASKVSSMRDAYVKATRAMIKATRFMYQHKAKAVDIAVKYVRGGEKARKNVSRTYDIITGEKIWSVNVGLPRKTLDWTNDLNVKFKRYKGGKPNVEKLVDFSIGRDALKPLGVWGKDKGWNPDH